MTMIIRAQMKIKNQILFDEPQSGVNLAIEERKKKKTNESKAKNKHNFNEHKT